MADQSTLYRGLSRSAWGYLLIHLDINLGTVSILPQFAGYLLLLSAVGKLSGERRDLVLLRPLCVLLAVWHGVDWLFSWKGASLGGMLPPLDLVIAAAQVYFHFQFLTDMAALAESCQPEGDDLDRRLLRRRTAYIVLATAAHLLLGLPGGGSEEWRVIAVGVLAAVMLGAAVFVMLGLFELRRCFREEEEEQPDV